MTLANCEKARSFSIYNPAQPTGALYSNFVLPCSPGFARLGYPVHNGHCEGRYWGNDHRDSDAIGLFRWPLKRS